MKIRISNLDRSVSQLDLIELFEDFGDVKSVKVLATTYDDTRSKMALVEMEDMASALEAIEELNGDLYFGRYINVKADNQSFVEAEDSHDEEDDDDEFEKKWKGNFEKIKRKNYQDYE